MKKFKVLANAHFTIVTEVEANTEEDARQIAQDREVYVCIHGSENCDGTNAEEFTLEDGDCIHFEIDDVEEQ